AAVPWCAPASGTDLGSTGTATRTGTRRGGRLGDPAAVPAPAVQLPAHADLAGSAAVSSTAGTLAAVSSTGAAAPAGSTDAPAGRPGQHPAALAVLERYLDMRGHTRSCPEPLTFSPIALSAQRYVT